MAALRPMTSAEQLFAVAVGGAVGGGARFWVSGFITRRLGVDFPWGTLVVNVSGAAAIGILAAVLLTPVTHSMATVPVWLGLVIGMLGSYTTVSSFSLQTLALVRAGEPARAFGNIIGTVLLCLLVAALGYAVTLGLWG